MKISLVQQFSLFAKGGGIISDFKILKCITEIV